MAVFEGCLEEERYAMPPPGRSGPLDPSSVVIYEPGQVGFIRDEIGLHLIRATGGDTVSLHLYARPYGACNCYCPETGKVTLRQLADYSFRGRRAE